jgi:hypothetical protein
MARVEIRALREAREAPVLREKLPLIQTHRKKGKENETSIKIQTTRQKTSDRKQ